ncbi:MAG: primosomal protein N' [Chthoniobacterales bacterium]
MLESSEKKIIARVVLDRAAGKPLDYLVPVEFSSQVQVGSRVRVPVRGSRSLATVVALPEEGEVPNLKPIESVVEGNPKVLPVLLKLAELMSEYYCCTSEAALRTVLPQGVRDGSVTRKMLAAVELTRAISEGEIESLEKRAPRQAKALRLLREAFEKENGRPLLLSVLRDEGVSAASIKSLSERGLVRSLRVEVGRDPHAGETYLPVKAPELNDEQRSVVELLVGQIDAYPELCKPLLLNGVTGSGKTEVYLRAIEHVLAKGRTALVLVPEIALTPQTVERFKMRFAETPYEVGVLHSHLSSGERYDEWFRIQNGEASIVIGARSAVFAPLKNLGLIVVDEEHEGSYKQDEAPRYHARDMAVVRAKFENCPIVLGTATPSMESYLNVMNGRYDMSELTERVDDRSLPVIRVLDMRLMKRGAGGPDAILSNPLARSITSRLEKGEQCILFLNRRGYSTSLICNECGHVCTCPNCSVALTYHRGDSRITCHICGHVALAPQDCPECKAPGIRYSGFGTEKLEEAVLKLFPKARIARMDTDTMSRKNAYRETLGRFRAGKIDILVGTQMIAKGLHFPNVTLVGIINADVGLHMPDFRAGERTFQLLTQVSGRAGRGELEGEVLVQTFTPQSPSIQFARRADFVGFWEQESDFRRHFRYPPFSRMILLLVRGEKKELTSFTADTLVRRLAERLPEGTILGEASPAPIEKAKNYYRFHIVIRGPKGMLLSRYVAGVLRAFTVPQGVHIAVDVDPLQLL